MRSCVHRWGVQTGAMRQREVEAGEDCDEGPSSNKGDCANCKTAVCGDGFVREGQEQCDDHNAISGDGCSTICEWEPVQLALGGNSTCALSAVGTVKCWGENDYGQLGLGDTQRRGDDSNEMGSSLPTLDMGTNVKVVALSSSPLSHATCAQLINGQLKCWGWNFSGQLGTGDRKNRGDAPGQMGDALQLLALNNGERVSATDISSSGACAVLESGAVRCWGSGESGLLGQGDLLDQISASSAPKIELTDSTAVLDVKIGASEACALLFGGAVKCWGNNFGGQQSTSPVLGDQPGEIENLSSVPLGTGRRAKSIEVSSGFACAILDDDTLKCWGYNPYGNLGQGDYKDRRDVKSELGDNLAPVDLGKNRTVRSVALGETFVCALLDNGTVKCWGGNTSGQLGLGDSVGRGGKPGEMGDSLPPVSLGAGRSVKRLDAGTKHVCAILDNGTVKCWGDNFDGRLGLEDIVNRGDQPNQMGDALPRVKLRF